MSLVTYGANTRVFRFGNFEYKYKYNIPVNLNKGANYNSGYIEGYQRALRDFENSTRKTMSDKGRMCLSFYN